MHYPIFHCTFRTFLGWDPETTPKPPKGIEPFYTMKDQEWADSWIKHVLEVLKDHSKRDLNLDVVSENGKIVKDSFMLPGISNDIKISLWRTEDSNHLQEWLKRSDKQRMQISIHIAFDCPNPNIYGTIDLYKPAPPSE
jgi:hypothetical protein